MRYGKRILSIIALLSAAVLILIGSRRGSSLAPYGEPDTVLKTQVCIESGDLLGSGSIWEIGEDCITVVTASHVISDPEDISALFPGGSVFKAEIVTNDPSRDYCFLVIRPGDGGRGGEAFDGINCTQVRPATSLPDAGARVFMALPFSLKSDNIGTVGLEGENSDTSVSVGTVISPSVYSEDFSENVIFCNIDVSEGMSGGGLFDDAGDYLGFLIGGTDEGAGVFLPVEALVR